MSGVLTDYINAWWSLGIFERLEDDTWYGHIRLCPGVWATANTFEECRDELKEVLEEWILLKLRNNDPMPEINGMDLSVKEEK